MMAFWVLTLAAVMGAALAYVHVARAWRRAWYVAAAHGAIGAIGFLLLILSPQVPDPLAVEHGVAPFVAYALWLFGVALLVGLGIATLSLRTRRSRGLLIAIHATVAVCAYALLLAYRALG